MTGKKDLKKMLDSIDEAVGNCLFGEGGYLYTEAVDLTIQKLMKHLVLSIAWFKLGYEDEGSEPSKATLIIDDYTIIIAKEEEKKDFSLKLIKEGDFND